MFLWARGASILVAAVFPLGQWLLFFVISPGALANVIGVFGVHVALLIFKYFVPALALYALGRRSGTDSEFQYGTKGRGVLLFGCGLVVAFGLARALASLIEGGGGCAAPGEK
jgi:hypothetical protein